MIGGGRWGQSAMGICALCYIYIYICNINGVLVFKRAMLNWRRRWGQSAMGICALCYICQVLCSGIQGIYAQLQGGNLPWVYVHCAIYETHLV